MTTFLGLAETVLRDGFIYGLMAMGVFVTYKILDFPDLSVDGTFPLGACVTAALICAGVNPWLACLAALLAGALAGSVTGLLHVKFHITDLLSGILVMTAMWSVTLIITGKSAILQFFNKPTIFTYGPMQHLPQVLYQHRHILVCLLLVVLVKLLLDWFLSTKYGLLLRGTGDNSQYIVSLGRDPGTIKIFGLALGNGLTALAGSVLAQLGENADVNAGKGMVVLALASVIIGTSIFHRVSFLKATTMAILGAVLYKACLQIALQLGLPPHYLKLLMAVLLTVALLSQRFYKKGGTMNART